MVRDLFQLNTLYKRLFIGGIAVFVVLCGAYGFLLKQTVASVVERRSIESHRADLSARVSMLEADYIRATDSITIAHARERGFVSVSATRFVSAAPAAFSFEYRAHE